MDPFFVHSYTHSIDKQRRLPIPKDWRVDDGPNRFVLLPGRHEGYKVVHAMTEQTFAETFLKPAKDVSIGDAAGNAALAQLGAFSVKCECDKQGRIKLSEQLMKHANLSEKATLIGALTTIHIVDPDAWNALDIDSVLDRIQKVQNTNKIL